jgi:hypothetical protein
MSAKSRVCLALIKFLLSVDYLDLEKNILNSMKLLHTGAIL